MTASNSPRRYTRPFFRLTALFLCVGLAAVVAGCASEASEPEANRLVRLTQPLLATEATTTAAVTLPTANEALEEQPDALLGLAPAAEAAEPDYDPENPKGFVVYFLDKNKLRSNVLDDQAFMDALKGKEKEEAMDFLMAYLSMEEYFVDEDEVPEVTTADMSVMAAPAVVEEPVYEEPVYEEPVVAEEPEVTEPPAAEPLTAEVEVTEAPTEPPIELPTEAPTEAPTEIPTEAPTEATQEVAAPAGDEVPSVANSLFELTNQARAAAGLPPLSFDANLYNIAAIRAHEIAQLFDHTRPNGQAATSMGIDMYGYSATGENIAYVSYAGSGQTFFDMFKGSSVHWSQMMSEKFTCMGVATVNVGGEYYTVMYFGKP